ncbi:MAG TPA: hypothetical protein VFT70_10300 [Nocardioides sp.]|nr:hypothetical protein [Nocardioides sp.]
MARGDIETVHQDGKWRNRVEGEGFLDGAYENRLDAALIGRELARERNVGHRTLEHDAAEKTARQPA